MSVTQKNNSTGAKSNATLPIIIAAAVLVVILMGWLYKKNFGPPPAPTMNTQQQSNHDYIKSVYDKTGGDYNKVSAEDKAKIDQMTQGHGAIAYSTINNN